MKIRLLFIASVIIWTSCDKPQNKADEILLSGFESVQYDFASLAFRVDASVLSLKENDLLIANVIDIYVDDSLLFISDDNKILSLFNLKTGEIIKQRKDVGHSRKEYIDICAVSGFGEHLFALDRGGRKLLQYDKGLNFITSIPLDFIPLDFEAVPNGFLFSRLDVPENGKRYVLMSLSGEKQQEFVNANKLGETVYTERSFASDGHLGHVYLHEPMRNEVYYFDGKKAQKKYDFVFQNTDNYESTVLRDCFLTSKNMIGSYINDRNLYYFIYSKDGKDLKTGRFDLNSRIPFSPMSQNGDVLYAVYHNEDLTQIGH